ncbi:hypothetical protein Cs7R123_08910 [Catellatospora sp. TT07R-123]|uniref:hypothetical protein n=1 Tax=Catellatospora sp. TT07R-123 TaxID=2733863 RepID=UPI001B1780AF|nr:hypothetical protein [Catellatospora sp. TT07R-123]GHJ43549.1 hypothetical protein Cs7R123_08910 [Catellatospora sp. TT07R-123]
MPSKSFYELTFGVSPGGARKCTHYLRGSLDEIRSDLGAELAEELNLYLLCWYGAELSIQVYQDGELERSVDLHPFVTIEVDGYPAITFTGPHQPVGYDFEADDDAEDEEETLSHRMFCGELGDAVSVTVAWDRIDVPPLTGVPLTADDVFDAADQRGYPYGYSDCEI